MSKKTQVNESDYTEMINNFFTKMINFVYNRYQIKKQYELFGLDRSFNTDYKNYVFEIDNLDLKVNGQVIQENVWNKGKLLRAENRLKALVLIDRGQAWVYNVDSLTIDEVNYKELEKVGYDDFMIHEIVETVDKALNI